jgi:hypothetical protein
VCDHDQNRISYKYNDARDCTWLNAYAEWSTDCLENDMDDDQLIEKYGADTHVFFDKVTEEFYEASNSGD